MVVGDSLSVDSYERGELVEMIIAKSGSAVGHSGMTSSSMPTATRREVAIWAWGEYQSVYAEKTSVPRSARTDCTGTGPSASAWSHDWARHSGLGHRSMNWYRARYRVNQSSAQCCIWNSECSLNDIMKESQTREAEGSSAGRGSLG
jgi:hypothetical protein